MHAEQSLPSAGSLAKGWDIRGIHHSTSCLKDISLGLDLISRERVKSARKERTDLPLALHSLEDFQVPNEKLGKSFGLSRESFIPHFSTPSTSTFSLLLGHALSLELLPLGGTHSPWYASLFSCIFCTPSS